LSLSSKEVEVLLPAFFLNCVVALGDVSSVAVSGAPPVRQWQTYGTGFFYGYLTKDDAEVTKREYEIYLVTARHVVGNRQNLKARVNPSGAGQAGQEFEIPSIPHPVSKLGSITPIRQ
jgi:S1-C subfamily serine protease